jgi:hypothetical protein
MLSPCHSRVVLEDGVIRKQGGGPCEVVFNFQESSSLTPDSPHFLQQILNLPCIFKMKKGFSIIET